MRDSEARCSKPSCDAPARLELLGCYYLCRDCAVEMQLCAYTAVAKSLEDFIHGFMARPKCATRCVTDFAEAIHTLLDDARREADFERDTEMRRRRHR